MRSQVFALIAICALVVFGVGLLPANAATRAPLAPTDTTPMVTASDLAAVARTSAMAQFDAVVELVVANAAAVTAAELAAAPDPKAVVDSETAAIAETAAGEPAVVTTPDFEEVVQDGPQVVAVNQQAGLSDPVRIVIPQIAMDLPLVSVGLDANNVPIVPNHDAAWYNLSARPGEGDNVVLWGHVLRFRYAPDIPAPFARVKDLPIGAPITVYNANGQAFNYVVAEQVWVQPHQVEYILPVGSERLTLVSCIGEHVIAEDGSVANMTHRLITIAAPVE